MSNPYRRVLDVDAGIDDARAGGLHWRAERPREIAELLQAAAAELSARLVNRFSVSGKPSAAPRRRG